MLSRRDCLTAAVAGIALTPAAGFVARRVAVYTPAYDVIDLRANLSYGNWDLSFYVRNQGSERGVLNVDDRQGAVTTTNVSFINPQTIGASLAFQF